MTMLLTTALALTSACDKADDGEGGDGETGNSDGNSDDNSDEGAQTCEDACANLQSCGISADECLEFCVDGPCGTCLANSNSCGEDCFDACAGGDGDGDPDPTGPEKECVINDDCGLSFECVSCGLNDSEGWCEQSSECQWDEDCGFGGKCGYNVETGAWRCLPAEYCE